MLNTAAVWYLCCNSGDIGLFSHLFMRSPTSGGASSGILNGRKCRCRGLSTADNSCSRTPNCTALKLFCDRIEWNLYISLNSYYWGIQSWVFGCQQVAMDVNRLCRRMSPHRITRPGSSIAIIVGHQLIGLEKPLSARLDLTPASSFLAQVIKLLAQPMAIKLTRDCSR